MDNTTAIRHIEKMGGRKELLHQITQDIWDWAIQKKMIIIPSFIPGVENSTADQLSRKNTDRNDWMLNPKIFWKIDFIWGPHHIDLFATRLNKQVTRFYSWKPEPGSLGVDSFKQSWKGIRGWANPPFNLIGKVLTKVRQSRAEISLIAPIWVTAPWFPVILVMCKSWPILFQDS